MSERVYELSKEDFKPINDLINYDPYLDNSLIPSIPEQWTKDDYLTKHPEMKEQVEELTKKREEALQHLKTDKDLNIIFAREQCELREGAALGLSDDNYYLYIKATDEFLDKADELLKRKFKSIKRANPETEEKIITKLNEEESNANAGVGFLFG
jgi:hypothetical protein